METTQHTRAAFDVDRLQAALLDPPVLRIGHAGQHHVLVAEQQSIGDVELRSAGETVTIVGATIVTAPNRRKWIVGTDLASVMWAAMLWDPFHAVIHP